MKNILRKFSIHSILLCSYSCVFLLALAFGSSILYFAVHTAMEQKIERELKTSTGIILNMIQTAVETSIRNHLRAVAERNREIVAHFYKQYKAGVISESEAMARAEETLLSQTLGKTGYIYCLDSTGTIRIHPEKILVGTDLSRYDFIKREKRKKEGYIEYVWANPAEETKREKASYITYFAPWDWIITASSYRDEFDDLIRVADFREKILSISYGKGGYVFVMDSRGNLVMHPELERKNIYDAEDARGRRFIQEICEMKNGKLTYFWKNSGETEPREKRVLFNYIPELDWIVASSFFTDESYRSLKPIRYAILVAIGVMLLLTLWITWWISSNIARPMQSLIKSFKAGIEGDFSRRLDVHWGGEMACAAGYYNAFMEQLQKTARKLQESEAKYRSIFENSVEGIFQMTPEGRFITVNPAMVAMLGYAAQDELIRRGDEIRQHVRVNQPDRESFLRSITEYEVVNGYEVQFYCKDGSLIWCSLNARLYKDDQGRILYLEGFVRDITTRKQSEADLKRSCEDLELRVQQRTAELSRWVSELERRNSESVLLREMSEKIQICNVYSEVYLVASQYLKKIFPGDSGQLFVFNSTQEFMEPLAAWGKLEQKKEVLFPEHCWALRQCKPCMIKNPGDRLLCIHPYLSLAPASLCVPMMTRDKAIGMLYIDLQVDSTDSAAGNQEEMLRAKQRLAVTIVEHLALTLTNLKLRETLRLQSIIDPLTGLYNRRYLDEILKREFHSLTRHNYSIGVIMIDVDHFKMFNDNYGHSCGDSVLRKLGEFLKKNIRGEDIACRYGGEEFALILVRTDLAGVRRKAEELCRGVREDLSVNYGGKDFKITISVGVSLLSEHGLTVAEVFRAADAALYQAKAAGRDRVCAAKAATPGDRSKKFKVLCSASTNGGNDRQASSR